MFFPERIRSIKPKDKVLEIGPGATPHIRSDIFLELNYDNEYERVAQSGHVGILKSDKPIIYYDGGDFPFKDNEFDYVICSHVLEHVDNADAFIKEVARVGKKGYLEFPTIYYDYIYNFKEHKLFLLEKDGVINWMTKNESGLNKFAAVQSFFNKTCKLGYYDTIDNFKNYFFQGFEWVDKIKTQRIDNLDALTYNIEALQLKSNVKKENSITHLYSKISLKKFLIYKLKQFLKTNLQKLTLRRYN
ncbi:MAG: methyltransferase domain-containing protein [Winogradskyella sp.]|uniref:class I SAM-dependent methyltransferase n=1 Tax=Winogradskyella sp. TaxID=1883156 RepID=UPI0017A69B12|nr:methyltransferase domain-containing protein [Winogradskyella sp.]